MKQLPLVSIITPCYNGAEFLDGYFQAILDQSYTNMELIFVDDGSTDGTGQIAESYRQRLSERGVPFTYIYQENGGQAAALNRGLEIFRGEYFTWPDSDDLLDPQSISKRAAFLDLNPEFGFVRSNADYFDYRTKKRLYRASNSENRFSSDIFLDLIQEETYCCCGCYMVRRDAFLKVYPQRQIQVSNAGQNWQILIPISAGNRCGYVDEDLYHIAVREGSHSRSSRDYSQAIARQENLKEILLSSIAISGRRDRDYNRIVEEKYLRIFFLVSTNYGEHKAAKAYYTCLCKKRGVTRDIRMRYLKTFHPGFAIVYDIWVRGCGKIKRTLGKF